MRRQSVSERPSFCLPLKLLIQWWIDSLNNVLSALVSENLTNTQKQAVIDRFLYSVGLDHWRMSWVLITNAQGDQQGGTSLLQVKMQAAIVTRQRFERFQADVNCSQSILNAQMINVDGINIQLDVILQGFDSIKSFYEQVSSRMRDGEGC